MDEFYRELRKLMPLKYVKGDFREVLSEVLDKYVSLLKENEAIFCLDIDEVINYVQKRNAQIKECVNNHYKSMSSIAYSHIEDILSDDIYKDSYFPILLDSVFYRARETETCEKLTFDEMFHIPLDQRGKVKPQRYSALGHPCLYLGASINVCWEELGRPLFDDLMISRFVVKNKFQVLDLRIPQREDFEGDKLDVILKRMPLIISASIVVLNTKDSFKPEYIISQLIVEYIITNNQKEYREGKRDLFHFILGVYYTSTHINDDFEFPEDVYNLALPVVVVEGECVYCQLLASCFEWTNSTSYNYEEIREKSESVFRDVYEYSELTRKELNDECLKMRNLKQRMSTFSLHHFNYCLPNRKEIYLDADGKMISDNFSIRSKSQWMFKDEK